MRCAVLHLAVLAAGQLFSSAAVATAEEFRASVQPEPPRGEANRHYVSNRAPLLSSPLVKLPIGAIRAGGWLRRQLELMASGMAGRLPELSRWCRFEGSAWANAAGEGQHGWEELPYWLKGFAHLGYLLGDDGLQRLARRWIEAALSSQEEDGYFGPRENKAKDDLWPNMVVLNVLQDFHEATGDARVIPFLLRYAKWQLGLPRERLLPGSWQKLRGGDNLATVYWLYNRTGEAWLLELAKVIHDRTAAWADDLVSWHGVNICQGFREPAVFYQQSKDPRHLAAAERNYRKVMELYGQVPGGMFGADENCRPGFSGPRQGAETCSMVEFMLSFEMLLAISGDPLHADRCEEVAFNSLPASHTADLKALHYLTAPNLVQCDQENKSPGIENGGCMLAFSPGERYRCCQHNAAHGWPYFAEHLWMATRDNGLAAVLYAPCRVEAMVGEGTRVAIEERTDYPFHDGVTFRLSTPQPVSFPLALRIPGWAEGATAVLNGQRVEADASPLSYLVIERQWRDGDVLHLNLPMQLVVRRWKANHDAASVSRGPLIYSLKIGERWAKFGGTDEWPELELFPTTPWNYGLVLQPEHPELSFEVVLKGLQVSAVRQPFEPEAAPVLLKAKGKRIPRWKLEGGLAGDLQASPVRSSEPLEEITLIPMGCARLRITAFPVIGEGPDAAEWKEPPEPPGASHLHDSIFALNDGILPKDSGDHSIPRFTWWDHRGTTEWVSYKFERPRRIASASVYWFDDTGRGLCRVPKSWRLLWKDGGEWRPVARPSAYNAGRDQLHKVTFDPVETVEVRLEAQLQDGFSGGILEWRVE